MKLPSVNPLKPLLMKVKNIEDRLNKGEKVKETEIQKVLDEILEYQMKFQMIAMVDIPIMGFRQNKNKFQKTSDDLGGWVNMIETDLKDSSKFVKINEYYIKREFLKEIDIP